MQIQIPIAQETPGGEELTKLAYERFERWWAQTQDYREKCRHYEQLWRGNHWDGVPVGREDEPRPVTPVLFSTLESLEADIMDQFPEAAVLAQEECDLELAGTLQEVIRYIHKRRRFRQTYRQKVRQALKKGTSVTEVFWNPALYGGLGDVDIRCLNIQHFYWDPYCERFQDGRGCFKTTFYPREWFAVRYPKQYPFMADRRYSPFEGQRDGPDDENLMLMEYWWKEYDPDSGRERVHMAKFAGGVLLEDSRSTAPEGYYRHGKYPFIVEPLFAIDDRVQGMGLIELFADLQLYIDKLDQVLLKNAILSGKLKMLVNRNAEIDPDAMRDYSREVVEGSRIDEQAVRWFQAQPVNHMVFAHHQQKVNAIREESGQNQFTRGEGGRGITAASAIIALQEAGSKRSRMLIEQMYDGFEEMVRMEIDLIAEHYTEARVLTLTGEDGPRRITLSAAELNLDDMGRDTPLDWDIVISAQRHTPYQAMALNELALRLYDSGHGELTLEDTLAVMDFAGKEKLLHTLRTRRESAQAATALGEG